MQKRTWVVVTDVALILALTGGWYWVATADSKPTPPAARQADARRDPAAYAAVDASPRECDHAAGQSTDCVYQ